MKRNASDKLDFELLVGNLQAVARKYHSGQSSESTDDDVVAEFLAKRQFLEAMRPDIFIIANLVRPLPFLYEHNYSFDLGIPDSGYAAIAKYISPQTLQLSDTIDQKIVECAYKNNIKPFDFIYRLYFEVDCPNPNLKRICRSVLMIAANSAGQCSHCLVYLNNVTEQVSSIRYPGYEIRFAPPLKHIEDALLKTLPNTLPAPYNLTDRECEIIENLHRGLSSKMIAQELSISKHTVDTHRRNILRKLQVANTAGILQVSSRLGII